MQQNRRLGEIVSQYENTVQRGEITPLENLYFITPESLGLERGDLFITPAEANAGRRILNPQAYPHVFGLLAPLYQEGGQSITMSGSIASADAITAYLQSHFPQKKFAVVHSKTELPEETLQDFKMQEIDHLIAVEMLDEAFDLPELTTLIDLTPSASARQIIQRFARPSRLADGKSEVTVALFLGITEKYLSEQIELLDRLLEGRTKAAQSGDVLPRIRTRPALGIPRQAPLFQDWEALKQQLIVFRAKRNKPESERIAEFEDFVRQHRDDENILPSASAKDAQVRSLGQWLDSFKRRNGDTWYEKLASDVIGILRNRNLLGRLKATEAERIAEVENHIRAHRDDKTVLPSSAAKDAQVRALGKWLVKFRHRGGETWYEKLASDVIEILRDRDLLGRLMVPEAERIAAVENYIREHRDDKTVLPSARAKDPKEKSLGVWIRNFKYRNSDTWYEKLAPDVVEILRSRGLIGTP